MSDDDAPDGGDGDGSALYDNATPSEAVDGGVTEVLHFSDGTTVLGTDPFGTLSTEDVPEDADLVDRELVRY